MRIVKQRERIEEVSYSLEYRYKNDKGAGFSFPCDKDGNVLMDEMSPEGLANLSKCRSGEYEVIRIGVSERFHTYFEPRVGECRCGAHVELHGFTNTCEKCGRDYNSSGQLLAPREQWGEETGESLSDILRIK